MTERIALARDGSYTAYSGIYTLHSERNPKLEADRYLSSLNLPPHIPAVILLGPCLGYLAYSMHDHFPDCKIVAIQLSSFFSDSIQSIKGCVSWAPGHGLLKTFLDESLTDQEVSSVAVIEWKPAIKAYASTAREVLPVIQTFITRAKANQDTLKYFGHRWVKNAVHNANRSRKIFTIEPGDTPVVIAISGPSLNDVIPVLKKARYELPFFLLAVSSASEALLANDIVPDLIIATDGGNWASYHLFEAARNRLPVIAPLTALLPSQYDDIPHLYLGDGSAWQAALLQGSALPVLSVPQRGTVSATALDLALSITAGLVYIAGLDLSNKDMQTHCKPYALRRFWDGESTRLNPSYSAAFSRYLATQSSSALSVYADYFKERAREMQERLIMLRCSHPAFEYCKHSSSIAAEGTHLPELVSYLKNADTGRTADSTMILLNAASDIRIARELTLLIGLEKILSNVDIPTRVRSAITELLATGNDHA